MCNKNRDRHCSTFGLVDPPNLKRISDLTRVELHSLSEPGGPLEDEARQCTDVFREQDVTHS